MTKEQIEFPPEFQDTLLVLQMGAKKYGANSWLEGNHFDIHKNHKSMSHHLLESYREVRKDHESGLDPLLHLACRALMEYTLRKRGQVLKDGTVLARLPQPHSLDDVTLTMNALKMKGNYLDKVQELKDNGFKVDKE